MPIFSLKSQQEFDLINKLGKKYSCKYFILVIAKNCAKIFSFPTDNLFLGMKVGRKLDKKAVIRNKIKRRIRHLTRLVYSNSNFSLRGAILIIPRKGFDKIIFADLLRELEKLVTRI